MHRNHLEKGFSPFRYSGEYFDKSSNTYYLRARYYNPAIGRFITEDTVWGNSEDPLSLNLYIFCANNPIVFIDPSGNVMEGDLEKYGEDSWAYQELVRLGDLWWEADAIGDQAEKDRLHKVANELRTLADNVLNDTYKDSHNCYFFAFQFENTTGKNAEDLSPGMLGNTKNIPKADYSYVHLVYLSSQNENTASSIQIRLAIQAKVKLGESHFIAIQSDAKQNNIKVEKIGVNEVVDDGYYRVSLIWAGAGTDNAGWHYVMQTSSGLWLEKNGSGEIRVLENGPYEVDEYIHIIDFAVSNR